MQVETHIRKSGTDFSVDPVDAIRINLSAVQRRVATLGGRRTVK